VDAEAEILPPAVRFAAWLRRRLVDPDDPPTWWGTRFAFLRGLGLIYLVAFGSLARQVLPLLGHDGLLPVDLWVERLRAHFGSTLGALAAEPSLFLVVHPSDGLLLGLALIGTALALALLLGYARGWQLLLLWALYLSFIDVGQVFYGYGWESLLVETGFLAVFLVPFARGPMADPPVVVVWLLRWLAFRVMFGAGLIKLRGDECWRDLTCLFYHYETQPIPNPLSWALHQAPPWFHAAGVLFNHFVELIVPWSVFGPRRVRHVGGLFLVLFQVFLIGSGNLSFLNWLTIVVCLSCFDDRVWRMKRSGRPLPALHRRFVYGLAGVVALLSVQPVLNMLSPGQVMNTSFDPLRLVNTYGAFGSVGRERDEVVLEGTDDDPDSPDARWREYEFPCKPGDPARRPCVVTPWHWRLDWQMWFAAMSDSTHEPWLVHLAYKLLRGDRAVIGLLANDPFPDHPPRYVRAELYRYEFTRGAQSGWWRRWRLGPYLPVLTADDPDLLAYLRARGWD
jgi:hypothetical protein